MRRANHQVTGTPGATKGSTSSLRFNKGHLLFGLSRFEEAQAELRTVTELRPADILSAAVLLAAIAWPTDTSQARQHLQAALSSRGNTSAPSPARSTAPSRSPDSARPKTPSRNWKRRTLPHRTRDRAGRHRWGTAQPIPRPAATQTRTARAILRAGTTWHSDTKTAWHVRAGAQTLVKWSLRYFSPSSQKNVTMCRRPGCSARNWRAASRLAPELGPANNPC
jgi:hypothetical protein